MCAILFFGLFEVFVREKNGFNTLQVPPCFRLFQWKASFSLFEYGWSFTSTIWLTCQFQLNTCVYRKNRDLCIDRPCINVIFSFSVSFTPSRKLQSFVRTFLLMFDMILAIILYSFRDNEKESNGSTKVFRFDQWVVPYWSFPRCKPLGRGFSRIWARIVGGMAKITVGLHDG